MKKKLIIAAVILALVITSIITLWQSYDLSSDYNYATAKLDIKDGQVKMIHIGVQRISSKDKEIEMAAARYGFRNIYIEKFTQKQTEKGITDYNKLIDTYLILRNGTDWKKNYKREVDSLYKTAFDQNN